MIALNPRLIIKLNKLNEPVSRLRTRLLHRRSRPVSFVIPYSRFCTFLGCLTIPADAVLVSACDGVKVPLPTLCSTHAFLSRRAVRVLPPAAGNLQPQRFRLVPIDQVAGLFWIHVNVLVQYS